jgi:hypothetical protein
MPRDNSTIRQIKALSKNIEDSLYAIENLIKAEYPEKYEIFYQHIMPQILTALNDDTKWLSRGNYSIEYIVKSIINSNDSNSGLKKYTG